MFESLTKKKKLDKARKLFEDAATYDRKWQREAREDFDFRDGDQWPADEKKILEAELRPCLTFNLTKSSIDLIMGMNEDNRKRFRASPVEPTDAFLAEILNDIDEYLVDANDFIDEEDAALESAAICGRGYVGIDFVPDPKRFGEIVLAEVSVPVSEVHFAPSARRPTLEDSGYICWDRWVQVEDFKARYPAVSAKKLEELLDSGGNDFDDSVAMKAPIITDDINVVDEENSDYDTPMSEDDFIYFNKSKDLVRFVHLEYWETFKRYFGFNPKTREFVEFTGVSLKKAKAAHKAEFGEDLTYEILIDKRVMWLQFTGDTILYDGPSPLPFAGFSLVPCFAYRDVSGRTANHFGVVRLIKDPQREVNKRWSQALNMLNQQVQPGLYAESDAFVNANQAEVALKEAGSIAWVQAGALAGGKIQERTVPKFPSAPMQMEQFSQDIMKKITGINPDLLGHDRGRQEAGVVIRLRQQQGITLLKPLFRSVNNMKKGLFNRRLSIVMKYMPEKQILRILGQGDRYRIDKSTGVITDTNSGLTANLRDVRNLEYNIKAEESKGNMTKRMLEIATLMEMRQAGFPVDPIVVIEKMELSATEKARWIQFIENQNKVQTQQVQAATDFDKEAKDRELRIKENKNIIEFITDMAKIEQMSSKDKDKKVGEFAKLEQKEKSDLRSFVGNMLQLMAQLEISNSKEDSSKGASKDGPKN